MNSFIGYGRLVDDIKMLKADSGNERGVFTLAVPRSYKNAKGGYDTDFIPCVVFNDHLKNLLTRYTVRGTRINIRGMLQINSWQDNGEWKNMTQVIVNEVSLIDTKEERQQASNEQQTQGNDNQAPRTQSTVSKARQQNKAKQENEQVESNVVSEEDLPF